MKVLVMGAGVVGVTTAYYLARDGHEVTVVDRLPGPALGASGGDAGEVCPSAAAPWAAPGMRIKTMQSLLTQDGPLRVQWQVDASLVRWMLAWSAQCRSDRYEVNRERMHRVARYSLHCLQALRRSLDLDYHASGDGLLQLLRTDQELRWVTQQFALLDQLNIPYTVLDPAGCCNVEPALEGTEADYKGGLYLPMDELGDCALFTMLLEQHAKTAGVQFRYNNRVDAIELEGDRICAVRTVHERLEADCYIVAMGAGAIKRLQSMGLSLPLQPVKTYNVCFPVREEALLPRVGIIDERHRVSVTRLGDRLCVGGKAELGSWSAAPRPQRAEALGAFARELFPQCAEFDRPELNAGLQATTPDGPPILGKSPWSNLLLNIGHGAHGWSMACGSAKVIADLLAGRKTEIPLDGLGIERYRR